MKSSNLLQKGAQPSSFLLKDEKTFYFFFWVDSSFLHSSTGSYIVKRDLYAKTRNNPNKLHRFGLHYKVTELLKREKNFQIPR